jgi:hypothetical protein
VKREGKQMTPKHNPSSHPLDVAIIGCGFTGLMLK